MWWSSLTFETHAPAATILIRLLAGAVLHRVMTIELKVFRDTEGLTIRAMC